MRRLVLVFEGAHRYTQDVQQPQRRARYPFVRRGINNSNAKEADRPTHCELDWAPGLSVFSEAAVLSSVGLLPGMRIPML